MDTCEHCGLEVPTTSEDSRTNYDWTPTRWELIREVPGPNHPLNLCAPCAKRHHEHWNQVWEEYYQQVGPPRAPTPKEAADLKVKAGY